jgi:hypothetical protein
MWVAAIEAGCNLAAALVPSEPGIESVRDCGQGGIINNESRCCEGHKKEWERVEEVPLDSTCQCDSQLWDALQDKATAVRA